jgi:hypothetical protein
VGEELAQLALGALDQLGDVEAVDIKRTIFDSYLEGLRDEGWQGDAQEVRFGFVTSTVLRMGLMLLWVLDQALEEGSLDELSSTEQSAKQAHFVLETADEAYEFLDSIAWRAG